MIRINLAPPRQRHGLREFRFQMPSLNLGIVFLVAYVAAASGITIYWAQLYRHEAQLTGEIAKAQQELSRLTPITAQAAKVKDQLADLQKRVKTIDELTKDQSKPIRILDAFATVIPKARITCSTVSWRRSSITISAPAAAITAPDAPSV